MNTENMFQSLAEFHLSSLWTWKPEGRNRIVQSLKSLDLDQVYLHWDEAGWLLVRCPETNKKDILKTYLGVQAEMEAEVKDQDIMQPNNLLWYDAQSSSVAELSPDLSVPDATVELEVPVELRTFQEVIAWQDLQPQDRGFSVDFLMDGARKAIEEAHGAKLYIDWSARVIFIGAASKATCQVVQVKLSTLLRSSLLPRASTRHVFFVEEKASGPGWTVDVRDTKQINPVLAPSTLLDPLDHVLPEQYGIVYNDAYCLRLCYKDPFRNITWSTFGPRAQDVFGGRTPQRASRIFESVQATPKMCHSTKQEEIPATTIKQWIEELPDTKTGDSSVSDLEQRVRTMPLEGQSEDDPVPLRRAPSKRRDRCDVAPVDIPREQGSLLDGPISQDSASVLQRALRPHRRSIIVPHPDSMPKGQDPRPQLPATNGSVFDQHIKNFLQRLMCPMKASYGTIRLRAEIGRFYMKTVEQSGVACNKKRQPAKGWEADQLIARLNKSENNTFFTKIFSYWGNDADYLANMEENKQKIWNPIGQGCTFFDFHFHARTSAGVAAHFVLEVDGGDYSWHLREAHNSESPVVVHCLSQHWDLRLVASHDLTIDQNLHFGAFAAALVDTLVVRPPILEFQYDFDGPPPVTIDEVRVRQVRRFQTQNERTILDISRVFLTEVQDFPGTRSRAVRSIQGDDRKKGVFKGWYEATVSSARMEELLQQNAVLEPGDEVEWTLEQLEREGVFEDIYRPACQIVKRMDGVGVKCDNGMARTDATKAPRSYSSYQF